MARLEYAEERVVALPAPAAEPRRAWGLRFGSRRAAAYLLCGVVLFGLAVRLRQFLASPSYWYDEAYLLVNIYDRDFAELLGPLRAQVVMPPLYL